MEVDLIMLALFVTAPWPLFYEKGMKTWEIRSYPIDYRGPIVLVNAKNNTVICQMQLTECIPLNKERWEMNFEKHRTSCDYDSLPYKRNNSPAYAWVLSSPIKFDDPIHIDRNDKKPYLYLDSSIFESKSSSPITFHSERLACKFLGQTMLIYWMKKQYFALVAVSNLQTGETQLVTDEISENETSYIINQLNAK